MAQQTLKELLYDGSKVVVEVAKRDGLGRQIDTTYLVASNFNWSNLGSKPFSTISSDWFEVVGDELRVKKSYLDTLYPTLTTYNTLVNTTLPATYVAISGFKANYLDANNVIYENDNISNLTNDVGYITSSALANYYTKSETYNKTEVDNLIAGINQFEYVVAESLPTASADTMYKVYLIPSSHSASQNIKDEYITIRSGSEGSYTYAWEQIGSTSIDLSTYLKSANDIADGHIVVGTGSDATRDVADSGITISSGTLTNSSTVVPTSSAVYSALGGKQDTLTQGNGITITNNVVASVITATDVILDF